jgi:hypothetical protein
MSTPPDSTTRASTSAPAATAWPRSRTRWPSVTRLATRAPTRVATWSWRIRSSGTTRSGSASTPLKAIHRRRSSAPATRARTADRCQRSRRRRSAAAQSFAGTGSSRTTTSPFLRTRRVRGRVGESGSSCSARTATSLPEMSSPAIATPGSSASSSRGGVQHDGGLFTSSLRATALSGTPSAVLGWALRSRAGCSAPSGPSTIASRRTATDARFRST